MPSFDELELLAQTLEEDMGIFRLSQVITETMEIVRSDELFPFHSDDEVSFFIALTLNFFVAEFNEHVIRHRNCHHGIKIMDCAICLAYEEFKKFTSKGEEK